MVVDLGTGSGAVAEAMAGLFPSSLVVAVDLNPHAVAAARRRLPGRVQVVLCDATECLKGFDVAVANLPYLPVDLEEDGCGGFLSMAWAAGPRGERAERLCRHAVRASMAVGLVYSTLTPFNVRGCVESAGFRVVDLVERPLFFERLVAVVAVR